MSVKSIRLNKYLASIGVASRRRVDKYIANHQITINNQVAQLGAKINPALDIIKLNNIIIQKTNPKLVYIMLHKPTGVLSTAHDERGRRSVVDLVLSSVRLFPVGRLDYNSTGLILLTNDGDLALKLTHPRYHLPKTYLVTLANPIPPAKIKLLQQGVRLEDGLTAPAKVRLITKSIFEITIYEGKNRQIRRMCAALGLDLIFLHRTAIGHLQLGNLPLAQSRPLTASELSLLNNQRY